MAFTFTFTFTSRSTSTWLQAPVAVGNLVMRVVCVSDTHGMHARLDVPACDLLVHAGDFSRRGRREEFSAILAWMAAQPARARVLVAGNHDRFCEVASAEAHTLAAASGVRYLEDEGVEIEGLAIWGSPVTPAFHSLAFNRERGAALRAHWDRIPERVDLLVTHGPPRGLGDRVFFGAHVGCADLLARVRALAPRVHLFGHIHEARGEYHLAGVRTRFVNAANSHLLPLWTRQVTTLEL